MIQPAKLCNTGCKTDISYEREHIVKYTINASGIRTSQEANFYDMDFLLIYLHLLRCELLYWLHCTAHTVRAYMRSCMWAGATSAFDLDCPLPASQLPL
jgi:hypothetical protein